MINARDLNTYYAMVPLTDKSGNAFGVTIISYEIRRYRDLRNLLDTFAYQVRCTQRIVIPNATPYVPGDVANAADLIFSEYPAVVMNNIACNVQSPSAEIVSYSPR